LLKFVFCIDKYRKMAYDKSKRKNVIANICVDNTLKKYGKETKMYIIKTLQDLELLLDDITLQEGEILDEDCINAWNEKRSQQGYTRYSEDEDKLIIPAKGGKWFQHDIQA